jgi:DNA-binding MarR family transcriptional regulator
MATVKRQETVDNILKLADKLFRRLFASVPRELVELDFTMPQLKIVIMLFIAGPMRMSDLAAELGVTLATATGLVDRLVENDMVVRESQPDDRRVVLCRLSATGQKIVSGIWESSRNNSRTLLEKMDDDTLVKFTEVLETMLVSAEATAGPHE